MDVIEKKIIITALFSVIYFYYLIKITVNKKIELYDTFLLSLICLVPFFFLLVPNIETLSYAIFGVTFPFVVLFLILFIIIFFFILRITIKINNLKDQNCKIVQAIGLERMRNKNLRKKKLIK
jgi:hypothetical protein